MYILYGGRADYSKLDRHSHITWWELRWSAAGEKGYSLLPPWNVTHPNDCPQRFRFWRTPKAKQTKNYTFLEPRSYFRRTAKRRAWSRSRSLSTNGRKPPSPRSSIPLHHSAFATHKRTESDTIFQLDYPTNLRYVNIYICI